MDEKLILNLEDINKIVSEDFQLIGSSKHHRNRYKTKNGNETVLMSSKLVSDKSRKQFWYNLNLDIDVQTKMQHIYLVCGVEGVCIIPVSELDEIIKGASWKVLKNSKSYFLDVVIDSIGKVYILRNKYDLSRYFIAFKNQ